MTSADLRAVQAFVTGKAADLREAIAPVADEVEELTGSGWSGSAAESFAAAWAEWHDGSAKILDALGRIGAGLGLSAEGYDQTDGTLGTSYSRLASRLS
ncbi:WXG100 family type VII secretion target [Jatrophihabitans sp. YIM 134969]